MSKLFAPVVIADLYGNQMATSTLFSFFFLFSLNQSENETLDFHVIFLSEFVFPISSLSINFILEKNISMKRKQKTIRLNN